MAFKQPPILVVADNWFGNNGLLKPLSGALGSRVHLLARLRCNAALYAHISARRYATNTRTEYAFADVRRSIADTIARQGFDTGCPQLTKPEKIPSFNLHAARCMTKM